MLTKLDIYIELMTRKYLWFEVGTLFLYVLHTHFLLDVRELYKLYINIAN